MSAPQAEPRPELGKVLNRVARPPFACPCCRAREFYVVYELAVQWRCGHIRSLPPLRLPEGFVPGKTFGGRKNARRLVVAK